MRKAGGLLHMFFAFFLLPAGDGRSAEQSGPEPVIYLQQGWDDEIGKAIRRAFYHDSQGSELVPYDWFMALERKDDLGLLKDSLHEFGFIEDEADDLPIGFTLTKENPKSDFYCETTTNPDKPEPVRLPHVGFNCAACHTSKLSYQGKAYIVDGGASMQDNNQFLVTVISSLKDTFSDSRKFDQFAGKVLKQGSRLTKPALRSCLNKYLTLVTLPDRMIEDKGLKMYPTRWGLGRIDAYGRALNTGFIKLDPRNVRWLDAPVNFPHLWGAWQYNWVQWNGSIQNPMGRNIAQAIGLRAPLKFMEVGPPMDFGIELDELNQLEQKVRTLTAPLWPKEFPYDPNEAKIGHDRYNQKCAGCHRPKPLENGAFGHRYDISRAGHSMTDLAAIGTDPGQALNFYLRLIAPGRLGQYLDPKRYQELDNPHDSSEQAWPASEATKDLTTKIMELKKWSLATPNAWQAPLAYVARPHAGVWATPPFLHNGSVRTIMQLLSPVEKRDKSFCIGALQFDPQEIGFARNKCAPNEMPFDVTLPGNANTGHEFRDNDRSGHDFSREECAQLEERAENGILGCALKPNERKAIIEYLKTCDDENLLCNVAEPVARKQVADNLRSRATSRPSGR